MTTRPGTAPRTSYDTFLAAARATIGFTEPYGPEEVAALAFEQQSCVLHAAHDLYVQRAAWDTCPHCGGRATPGTGGHALCAARAARGRPTPKIDAAESCDCARCHPGSLR